MTTFYVFHPFHVSMDFLNKKIILFSMNFYKIENKFFTQIFILLALRRLDFYFQNFRD